MMALGRSVGEAKALKFVHFEKKFRMFGATYRRNASTYAEFSINLNKTSDILLQFQKSEFSLF